MRHHETLLNAAFGIDSANQPRVQGQTSEDAVLVQSGLLGVFDSVGGRDKGRLVSHLARKTIAAFWRSLSEIERHAPLEHLAQTMQTSIHQADVAIASLVIPPEQRRPATVVALCVLSAHQGQLFATVAHVGDSRVYLARQGQPLQRLTEDHGYFRFAVRQQRLTEQEAWRIEQAEQIEELSSEDQAHFRRRNEITGAVGWADYLVVPTSSHLLLPGDRVVLCTDGIHDNLADWEIEEILSTAGESGAQRLVNAAYQRSQEEHMRSKRDDLSAIVAYLRL
jgi:protein phosphatase